MFKSAPTSDAATTSGTFLYELNYATLYKTIYPHEALFTAAAIFLRATASSDEPLGLNLKKDEM